MREHVWQVDIGYACFGIVTQGEVVIHAAPIARWMIGRKRDDVRTFVRDKQGKIIRAKFELPIDKSHTT